MVKYIIVILTLSIFMSSCGNNTRLEEKVVAGYALGTTYHIKYLSSQDLDYRNSIDSIFYAVVNSMSIYVPTSDISKINSGDTTVVVDHMFKDVYMYSAKIFKETDGMFDPTIGVMVNAWGFGPKKFLNDLDENKVKELMKSVGFDKTRILANGVLEKNYSDTQLNFDAIAKGYTLDRVAVLFRENNIDNYLIEIGGEVVASGNKIDGSKWRIGIDDPHQKETRSLIDVVSVSSVSMATSGNYRRFRMDSLTGERYVHTINAKTGFTSRSNVMSATVIAKNCALADGYATAFMAMGLDATKSFLDNHLELDAYLIYIDEDGHWRKFMTERFKPFLSKK